MYTYYLDRIRPQARPFRLLVFCRRAVVAPDRNMERPVGVDHDSCELSPLSLVVIAMVGLHYSNLYYKASNPGIAIVAIILTD